MPRKPQHMAASADQLMRQRQWDEPSLGRSILGRISWGLILRFMGFSWGFRAKNMGNFRDVFACILVIFLGFDMKHLETIWDIGIWDACEEELGFEQEMIGIYTSTSHVESISWIWCNGIDRNVKPLCVCVFVLNMRILDDLIIFNQHKLGYAGKYGGGVIKHTTSMEVS